MAIAVKPGEIGFECVKRDIKDFLKGEGKKIEDLDPNEFKKLSKKYPNIAMLLFLNKIAYDPKSSETENYKLYLNDLYKHSDLLPEFKKLIERINSSDSA